MPDVSLSRQHATCWDLVGAAAAGPGAARSAFAGSYLPLIRSCLAERWRRSPLASLLDDAVQEVFVECFRHGGPLARAAADKGAFRPFLLGIVRNVARRFEERGHGKERLATESVVDGAEARDQRLTRMFDRDWASMLRREAGELQASRARDAGDGADKRVELLRLRFRDGLPIREIAAKWHVDAAWLHHEYAKARDEFRICLREVVGFHAVRSERDLDDECRRLLDLLG
jgi:RNA polymerase sigma-70 factor (ECF subfamily)